MKKVLLLISFLFILGMPVALGAGTFSMTHPLADEIYPLDYLHMNTEVNVSYQFNDLIDAYYLEFDLIGVDMDVSDGTDVLFRYTTDLIGSYAYNATMDGDGDGFVEWDDDLYPCLANYYGATCSGVGCPSCCDVCDLNGDGQIDATDASMASMAGTELYYFNYSMNWTSYPFDNFEYRINYTLYNKSGVEKENGTAGRFWAGSTQEFTYHFSIIDAYPAHLDYYGNIPENGCTFSLLSNRDAIDNFNILTAWYQLKGNDRELKGFGSREVYYKTRNNEPLWTRYTHKDSFQPNRGYYVYYGVRYDNDDDYPYTAANTYWTVMDDSVFKTNFSVIKALKDYNVHDDHTKTMKWIGVSRFFETEIGESNPLDGWSPEYQRPDATTFGQLIDNWANDPDVWGGTPPMPWFKTLVGIIVCLIAVCLPLGFSIRHDIDIPNFIYGVALTAGMFGAFALDLFTLWMLLLYILVIFFSLTYMYRETIFRSADLGIKTAELGMKQDEFEYQKKHRLKGVLKRLPSGQKSSKSKQSRPSGKVFFPSKPPMESDMDVAIQGMTRMTKKPPFIGLVRKKQTNSKGKSMPWAAYQGSKKKDRAIQKARETSKRRSK